MLKSDFLIPASMLFLDTLLLSACFLRGHIQNSNYWSKGFIGTNSFPIIRSYCALSLGQIHTRLQVRGSQPRDPRTASNNEA